MKGSHAGLVQLPRFFDPRGNLSVLENTNQIPFEIKRVHWIYDVPGGGDRGGVAYENTEEFIVAMSGSFDVIIDDGCERRTIQLNRSYYGIYVPKGVWREINNYSSNSVAVIAASTYYDPAEGTHSYAEFKSSFTPKYHALVEKCGCKTEEARKVFSLDDCYVITLDKHHSDNRGNLSVVENGIDIPFDIKRIYYLYDVPGGESRGGHAHKSLYQLIIAASGSFTVTLDDGQIKRSYMLNRPYQALLVKPGVWRTLDDFSSGSVCLVLASEIYDESDYIRNYEEFISFRKRK